VHESVVKQDVDDIIASARLLHSVVIVGNQ